MPRHQAPLSISLHVNSCVPKTLEPRGAFKAISEIRTAGHNSGFSVLSNDGLFMLSTVVVDVAVLQVRKEICPRHQVAAGEGECDFVHEKTVERCRVLVQ